MLGGSLYSPASLEGSTVLTGRGAAHARYFICLNLRCILVPPWQTEGNKKWAVVMVLGVGQIAPFFAGIKASQSCKRIIGCLQLPSWRKHTFLHAHAPFDILILEHMPEYVPQ